MLRVCLLRGCWRSMRRCVEECIEGVSIEGVLEEYEIERVC